MIRMWTIYRHPKDYPGQYVARLWEIDDAGPVATESILTSDTLNDLREQLAAMGLMKLHRNAEDDAVIVETWL